MTGAQQPDTELKSRLTGSDIAIRLRVGIFSTHHYRVGSSVTIRPCAPCARIAGRRSIARGERPAQRRGGRLAVELSIPSGKPPELEEAPARRDLAHSRARPGPRKSARTQRSRKVRSNSIGDVPRNRRKPSYRERMLAPLAATISSMPIGSAAFASMNSSALRTWLGMQPVHDRDTRR